MTLKYFRLSLFLAVFFYRNLVSIAQENPELPLINLEIVTYVKSTIGKKVDRGECWDLANQALTRSNAEWTFPTHFGKEVNPYKETIFPGDIIQFSHVKIKNGNGETWTFPKHTAIVYEVISKGIFKIAEQNVNGKRLVQLDELNINGKVSGKIIFYRPIKKI